MLVIPDGVFTVFLLLWEDTKIHLIRSQLLIFPWLSNSLLIDDTAISAVWSEILSQW
jgi:hypothetical protein